MSTRSSWPSLKDKKSVGVIDEDRETTGGPKAVTAANAAGKPCFEPRLPLVSGRDGLSVGHHHHREPSVPGVCAADIRRFPQ